MDSRSSLDALAGHCSSLNRQAQTHLVALELVLAGAERLPAALHRVVALPAAAIVDSALVRKVCQAPAFGRTRVQVLYEPPICPQICSELHAIWCDMSST